MFLNYLFVFCSFELDVNCLREKIFEISIPAPYVKFRDSPKSILNCLDSFEGFRTDAKHSTFAYSTKDERDRNFSIKSNSIRSQTACDVRFEFQNPIQKAWAFDSLKMAISLYSPFDSSRFIRMGENTSVYHHPEIAKPCHLDTWIYFGKNSYYNHAYRCEFPIKQYSTCDKLFDH